jgi:hypothetical protein
MAEPKALGAVLALLVDQRGDLVKGGSVRGQMYVSEREILVLRMPRREAIMHRAMLVLLIGSVGVAIANLALWKSMAVLWAALGAQVIYWLALPVRRRTLAPRPLAAADLDAARKARRAAIDIPAKALTRLVGPEPPRTGFRRPARFELPDGALEVYLSPEQFEEASAALGQAAAATPSERARPDA